MSSAAVMIGALRVECLTNRNNQILDNIAAIRLNLDVRSRLLENMGLTKGCFNDNAEVLPLNSP